MAVASPNAVPLETTLQVRDTCLCLHVQRAARSLAGRFDEALRPARLTNSQFSLLNVLNGPRPKTKGEVAAVIGADRTTVAAALKPLVRQGLVKVDADSGDRRVRRIALTADGHSRLAIALQLWIEAHGALEGELDGAQVGRMRQDLWALSAVRRSAPADQPANTNVSCARAGNS